MKNQLIPRQILFADPDKSQVKMSPNGEILSYLSPSKGKLNLWIAPIETLEKAKPITQSEHPIHDYWWSVCGEWIIYTHDYFGDENWQLYGYHLLTCETRVYTQRYCQARLLKMSSKHRDHVVIALNERDKCFHDVIKLNLQTGEMQCIFKNSQYWDFIVDDEYDCRIAIKINEEDGEYIDLRTGTSIVKITQHDLFGLYFHPRLKPVFSGDNQTLCVVQTANSNTSSLTMIDLTNLSVKVLANHDKADICDVLYHPQTKLPIAYAINYAKKEWHGLSPEVEKSIKNLKADPLAEMDLVSQNGRSNHWIVRFSYSDKATEYYRYSQIDEKRAYLFSSYEKIGEYNLSSMQPVEILMQDGTLCMSYLSLPQHQNGPYPLVMLVHGGPNSRDYWGFNPYHQWLTSRGYAVLSVNYRASTGFGRKHSESGNGEWAGKIREDILEAVEWAVQKGITTEDKVAIMGRSFGGYQVLLGLTFTPERYCCGVDIVGPANLETMMQCFPPYWAPMRGVLNAVVGCDPNTEEGKVFLKESSPLTYAKHIKRPLLIGHGMNDPRIQQTESDQMVSLMRANHIPVTYAVFSNEGHQLSHFENRMAFYSLVESFLAKNFQNEEEIAIEVEAFPSTMKVSVA